ncbi:hypothetical protein [Ramlibacter tataouinensis]|uniref:Uncharacterized protein n=1 Tax=Ramlibacter tataouinensis (strain ATCC BAA-407 / DSM 14655 / LMG 21543 / TTB310) TaxID=365046 RepID=F5Y050_RAMTT|nr:hypothetical protein [Ramlibacter tataouinensis]AEG94599.1 hypothetical protein Rta_34860 [Ramlibacter tataouinensis TTB310]
MLGRSVAAIILGLAASAAAAGSAGAQFGVMITLSRPGAGSNVCVSGTAASGGGTSVQVRCDGNVFVDISPVQPARTPEFMPAFRPARDTLLPDYCRTEQAGVSRQLAPSINCRLDDQAFSVGEAEQDGWRFGDQLFATNDEGVDQHLARMRRRDDRGTLTALRIIGAEQGRRAVELLVSF